MRVKEFFIRNKRQKVLNKLYSIWKKTFETIHQLSFFVRHYVSAECKIIKNSVLYEFAFITAVYNI